VFSQRGGRIKKKRGENHFGRGGKPPNIYRERTKSEKREKGKEKKREWIPRVGRKEKKTSKVFTSCSCAQRDTEKASEEGRERGGRGKRSFRSSFTNHCRGKGEQAIALFFCTPALPKSEEGTSMGGKEKGEEETHS